MSEPQKDRDQESSKSEECKKRDEPAIVESLPGLLFRLTDEYSLNVLDDEIALAVFPSAEKNL